MHRTTARAVAAAAMLAMTGTQNAQAQDWPTKQIKVIVPFTAGSATDIVARAVFEYIGREAGQSVVTENRGGGGTTIGSAAVAKSDPDGYTILVNSTSHVVVATTFPKLSYNVAEDFTALSGLAQQPFVITTRTKYKDLADFIAYGKADPGAINYGSAGIGTSGMLFCERFGLATGIKMTHVPFRGTPEAMTEIIADRLDMYPGPVVSVVELVADKKVAALAVSTPKRAQAFPNVPTLREAGVKGSDYIFWAGAFVPVKTPKAVSEKIHAGIMKALDNADVRQKIANLGAEPMPMSMSEFDKFVRDEIAGHAEIYEKAGIKP
jgi:tripartite-type tricarboxylate transporter receptor subunit TctC